MCGAYFLQQSASLRAHFGIESRADIADFMLRGDQVDPLSLFDAAGTPLLQLFRPTDQVPFLALDREGEWIGLTATWWLALEAEGDDWRPRQSLATFNSRIDKVVSNGNTIHKQPPRSFRVLLPASGFVEWHDKRPHCFRRADGKALMLGGMAKAYPVPSGHKFAVSIVTLPGHPSTRHIHEKSIPLMLQDNQIRHWLDRQRPHSDFRHFQTPTLPHTLTIQPVQDLKTMTPVGEPETVAAD